MNIYNYVLQNFLYEKMNTSQRKKYEKAMEEDILKNKKRKTKSLINWKKKGFRQARWLTKIDERTCPQCGPRHMKWFDIDMLLNNKDFMAPHAWCRCRLGNPKK